MIATQSEEERPVVSVARQNKVQTGNQAKMLKSEAVVAKRPLISITFKKAYIGLVCFAFYMVCVFHRNHYQGIPLQKKNKIARMYIRAEEINTHRGYYVFTLLLLAFVCNMNSCGNTPFLSF